MRRNGLGYCFYLIKSGLLPILVGTLGVFQAYSPAPAIASQKPLQNPAIMVEFDHVEDGGTILFRAPPGATAYKPHKTNLFDLGYIGALKSDQSLPYFLFSGKPCRDCLDDKSIYIMRPNGEKPLSFVYPVKILDPKNRSLLYESRAFYGKCLPRKGDVYVVFQKERVDRRHHLQSSVLIAEAAKAHLEENLIERHLPQIRTTLQMVKYKTCHEIQGRNRLMLSIPLDLHPHNSQDDKDDDDDNDSVVSEDKSNQDT